MLIYTHTSRVRSDVKRPSRGHFIFPLPALPLNRSEPLRGAGKDALKSRAQSPLPCTISWVNGSPIIRRSLGGIESTAWRKGPTVSLPRFDWRYGGFQPLAFQGVATKSVKNEKLIPGCSFGLGKSFR
jgi:hypothetical protein